MGKEEIFMTIGEKITNLRTAANISQEQLAAKLQLCGLDITQKAISRIETGLRVVADYEIRFLARVLEVEVMFLLGE